MQRFALTFARMSICLWVGGALLFVVTSIAEQTHPSFSEAIKNQLALIRFPWYYNFGFILVSMTLVAGHLARNHPDLTGAGRWLAPVVLTATLAAMTIDYRLVYRPLAAMVTPPDRAIPAEFETYHRMSMWVNIFHVGLATWGAVLLCRPAPVRWTPEDA